MSERYRPTMTETMYRVAEQTEQKKLWEAHDVPELIVDMIIEEAVELKDAVQESMLSGDVFNVASEVGDILYLALKFCHAVGLVPEDVVDMKIVRNDLKYPNYLNSHGSYEEQREKSREMWKALGGDKAFSHAYLDVLSKPEEEVVEQPTQNFAQALATSSTSRNGHSHHNENVTNLPILVYAGDNSEQ